MAEAMSSEGAFSLMICQNCGYGDANADPIDGRCPNCGTPYAAADDAATQASFTAPSSSPSTPYTQPYTVPAPPMFATGPTPPTAIPTYPSTPPARPRNASRLVLISIGVVVTMALLGGIALHGAATAATTSTTTASATVAASPTKVPGVTLALYTDPNQQFTIRYPSTWSPTSSTTMANGKSVNLTTFTAPNGRTAYLVALSSSPLAFSDVPTLLQSAVVQFMPNTPRPEQIKGITWQYEMGPATVHGKSGGVFALLSPHGGMSYLLLAYGEGAKFPTNGGKAFLKIARTFTPHG
jgi:hypothetical protein